MQPKTLARIANTLEVRSAAGTFTASVRRRKARRYANYLARKYPGSGAGGMLRAMNRDWRHAADIFPSSTNETR